MLTNDQKAHDIAVAFAQAEYKNELERRRGTKDEPVITVQDRASSFYAFYEESIVEFNDKLNDPDRPRHYSRSSGDPTVPD